MDPITQARPALAPGQRPIVIARDLAGGRAALEEAGIDPDNSRAYVVILTSVSSPVSAVIGARPHLHPVINAFPEDEEPSRFLGATIDYLEARGWPTIRGGRDGREGDTGDKSERGPRETPKPKPPAAPAPSSEAIAA